MLEEATAVEEAPPRSLILPSSHPEAQEVRPTRLQQDLRVDGDILQCLLVLFAHVPRRPVHVSVR